LEVTSKMKKVTGSTRGEKKLALKWQALPALPCSWLWMTR